MKLYWEAFWAGTRSETISLPPLPVESADRQPLLDDGQTGKMSSPKTRSPRTGPSTPRPTIPRNR